MDGDDAVFDLADTAEVLPLHAGSLGAGLHSRGLIDQTDGAQAIVGQAGQLGGNVALQLLADLGVMPSVVTEELLQSANGTASGQSDWFGSLALQVGEQATAVGLQVVEGLGVATAEQVPPQEVIQG